MLPLPLFYRRPLSADDRRDGDSKTMVPPATGGTDDPNSFGPNPNEPSTLEMGKNRGLGEEIKSGW
jgi:hypothetical protein